jgi:hypothetical protein
MTEQINEIGDTPAGKKALGSYIKKAAKKANVATQNGTLDAKMGDNENAGKAFATAKKRINGISQATDRLTKEEVEVNENLENILVHAWNKDAVHLRSALDAEMQSRISDHVDTMVADVSARLFTPSISTDNEDHEG